MQYSKVKKKLYKMNMLEAFTKGAQTTVQVSYDVICKRLKLIKSYNECKMNMHFLEEHILLYFQVFFFSLL